MKLSKKIFLLVAIIFILILAWFAYDVSNKTTFPGSKSKNEVRKDSVNTEFNKQIKSQETDTSIVR